MRSGATVATACLWGVWLALGCGQTSSGDGGAGGSAGHAGGTTPGGATEGGATALVDCDPRKVLCRVATPECPAGQVPSVEGSCYGDCVKIDRCSCASAEQCPDPDRYTCLLGPKHCSFYLK